VGNWISQTVALLRQAIALNPNHVGTNQLLADILLAQGEMDEAVQMLERFYEYQPAAARPRLVQALLAKVQVAESDYEQLTLYQKVLELEPAQPEATDRVAELTSKYPKNLGELLRYYRCRSNLTQRQLRDRLEDVGFPLGESTISMWESGRRLPSDPLLFLYLSRCLNLKQDEEALINAWMLGKFTRKLKGYDLLVKKTNRG